MILLLTNDDGIDAPGIAALEAAAGPLGEVWVVAPDRGRSNCSHTVTTHAPLRATPHGPRRFAIDGTPADCVRLAVHGLVPRPDWVLSGINAGGNLGADVYHSGTVAAVREAALAGWRGVAVSQYRKRDRTFDWGRASRWVAALLPGLLGEPLPVGGFWNVNLPNLEASEADPDVVRCPLDLSPLPVAFRADGAGWVYAGDYHTRRRGEGCDVGVCFGGRIAVTRLGLDLVARP